MANLETKITASTSKGAKYDVIIRNGRMYLVINNVEYYGTLQNGNGKPAISLYNAYKALGLPKQYEKGVMLLDEDPNPIIKFQNSEIERLKIKEKTDIATERGIKYAVVTYNNWDSFHNPEIIRMYPATKEEADATGYKEEYRKNYHHILDIVREVKMEHLGNLLENKKSDMNVGDHYYYFITKKEADTIIENKDREYEQKLQAQRAKKDEEQKRIDEIFLLAKTTGEKQVIDSYSTDCDRSVKECCTDIVTVYAMPDGSRTTNRVHCH